MTLRLVQANRSHLIQAALNLSQGDLTEFHCNIAGRDPVDVLPETLDETTHAIMLGSLVLAVGGTPADCIWFVTTRVVDELSVGQRMRFYRMLKDHLADVKRIGGNKNLSNFVSKDNIGHIRLLESLGATFQPGHTMSPAGFQFKQFWI